MKIRKKLLLYVSALLLVCSCLAVLTFVSVAGESTPPELSIEKCNLSFRDAIAIKYAVSVNGDVSGTVKVLIWTEPKTSEDEYVLGTEAQILETVGNTTTGGKTYRVFDLTDMASVQMADVVYARAYVEQDGEVYYSPIKKYSIVQYAHSKMDGDNETLKKLLDEMLKYGASAQNHFGHKVDDLATAERHMIKLKGGVLNDGCRDGLYKKHDRVKIKPDKAPDGYRFDRWENSKGETVSNDEELEITIGSEDETYEAVFVKIVADADGIIYTSNGDGTCFVSSIGTCTNESIGIPAVSPDGETVVAIGKGAFKDSKTVKEIILPDSVKSIDTEAFSGCTSLSKVTFGTGLKTVGSYAFYNCTALADVTLPAGVTYIGDCAFRGCTALTTTSMPDSLEFVGDLAFFACPNLVTTEYEGARYLGNSENPYVILMSAVDPAAETCTIQESTRVIYYEAFKDCTALKRITIPEGVICVGTSAFYNCTSLEGITLPDSVKYLGDSAFFNCSSLKKAILGTGITKIGANTFYDCNLMKDVTIGENVTSIGVSAFAYCRSLTEIALPEGLMSIADSAFAYCSGLESIFIPSAVTRIEAKTFYECTALERIALPSAAKHVGDSAFYGCVSLRTVTVPAGVTYVGSSAFYGCTSLTSVNLSAALETIGAQAFYGCTKLANLTVGNQLTAIGAGAFYNCESLTSITVPNGVTAIEKDTFYNCKSLTGVTLGTGVTSIGDYAFYGNASLQSIAIPNGVTTIGQYAFNGCSAMTTATLGSSVETIGKYAFYDCSSLTGITIPDTTTSIGESAFRNCSSMTSLTIGNRVETIGSNAFYACTSLVEVVVPDSVTTIQDYAFANCENIKYVTLSENLITLSRGAFYHCSNLRSISIPDGITEIKDSTFYNCTRLASVIIPESITMIGAYAFWDCRHLTSVTIPANVTSIGRDAFIGCNKLVEVINHSNLAIIKASYNHGYIASNALEIHDGESKIVNQDDYLMYIYENTRYLLGYIGRDTELVLPESFNGESYEIYSYAFYLCDEVTSLTIPEHVSAIGKYAFYGLTKLENISFNATACANLADQSYVFTNAGADGNGIKLVISNDVTHIPAYLFANMTKLISIVFEDESNCQTIGNYAFKGCTGIDTIVIPDSVTSVGNSAFGGCSNVTSLTIGKGVTSVGEGAFTSLKNLTYLYFNATLMNDLPSQSYASDGRNHVFSSAGVDGDGLNVIIGANVTRIPKALFYPNASASDPSVAAPKIVSVIFEEGSACTSIGQYAFYHCDDLYTITIPEKVEKIDYYAFRYCYRLVEVVNNSSLTIVAGDTSNVNGYIAVYALEVHSGTSKLVNQNGYLFYTCNDTNYLVGYVGTDTELTLPENYNGESYVINRYAFYKNTDITGVVMSDGVTAVYEYAFYGCTSLTDLVLGDNVVSIGNYAFYDCTALNNFIIPESVTTIGGSAFGNCTTITSITIPEGVTTIGAGAFGGCMALAELKYNAISVADSYRYSHFGAIGANTNGVQVTIGKNVAHIPDYMFYNITKVNISFEFAKDSNCKSIGKNAFNELAGLTSLELPASIESIDGNVFIKCHNLVNLTVHEDNTVYHSADNCLIETATGTLISGFSNSIIPDDGSVTVIGDQAFYQCTELTEITIPDTVITIGASAFYSCTSLKAIVIPDSVTEIGNHAFSNCTGVVSLTLGSGVKTVGESGFYYLTALEELYYNAVSIDNFASHYGFAYAGTSGTGIKMYVGKNVETLPHDMLALVVGNLKFVSVEFEKGSALKELSNGIFSKLTTLESLTIPFIGASRTDSETAYLGYLFGATDYTNQKVPTTLTTVTLTDATKIPANAFYGCTSLTTVNLPEGLTTIEANAFSGCTGLTDVYYLGSQEAWSAVTVANTDGGNDAFLAATIHYKDSDPTEA